MPSDRDPRHIARREALHIGASGALYLAGLAALWWLTRKLPRLWQRVTVAVVIIVAVIGNEIHDLNNGGWWVKSAIDLGVWAVALTVMVWGAWRFERRRL